jgi:lipopolysaccharide heptosyltransferase II
MNRVLVIQTAFLGDVILTLPLVQAIKRHLGDVQVDFLAIPETADVVKSHPDISQLLLYDKHGKHSSFSDFLELRAGLRRRVYNYVFCPHRSLRSALLAGGTRAQVRVGFDRTAWKRSFTHLMPWKFGIHEVERDLSLLAAIGIKAEREEPRLHPNEENREQVSRFLSSHGIEPPYAVVAPGTVWKTKQYPLEMMALVVRGLMAKFSAVVLIGGPRDLESAKDLAVAGGNVVSAIGEFSFMTSAELIRRASLLVANDSAPIHAASAFGVPTVAIFGPTVKDFGFYPYHESSKVVEADGLGCRPCSIHGGNRCPIGTFECMRSISPERVVAESFRLLEKTDG